MPSFMRQINVIGRCSAMVRNQKLADTGLTGWHYSYILTLCRNPGQSQEHLARHIYINKSNVTRHLTQLEKNGYVERRQSEEENKTAHEENEKAEEEARERARAEAEEAAKSAEADGKFPEDDFFDLFNQDGNDKNK